MGIEAHGVSHAERWVAALGAFTGILVTAWISSRYLSVGDTWLMVGSMGASAVLLFAVPHGQLSQPWAATGGQLISAAVGVTCAEWIPMPVLAAAAAVSLAVLAMHYAHCIHPPGGATALVAVVGGPAVHALGYGYVLAPVLLNVLVIGTVAVLVNYPFRWRRYPQRLIRTVAAPAPLHPHAGEKYVIAHSDLVYALSELDSFIDVSEGDLLRIYDLAVRHAVEPHPTGVPLKVVPAAA